MLAGPACGYIGCSSAIANMDLRPHLADIRTPLLWIAGAEDKLPPLEWVQSQAAEVPSGEFLTLSAAHLSNLEAQDEFTQIMQNFFL